MKWWQRGVALALAFVIALVVMFPLRMAWDAANAPADLAVGDASGTIWSGQLRDVTWRGVVLGDFEASLSPLDLLPSPALRLKGGSGPLKSAIVHGDSEGFTISEANIVVELSDIVAGAPPNLSASMTDAVVRLRGGRCIEAVGQISSPPAPVLGLPAFRGVLACDRGAILARLNSEAGDVVLEASIDFGSLSYRTASAPLLPALAALGIPATQRTE